MWMYTEGQFQKWNTACQAFNDKKSVGTASMSFTNVISVETKIKDWKSDFNKRLSEFRTGAYHRNIVFSHRHDLHY